MILNFVVMAQKKRLMLNKQKNEIIGQKLWLKLHLTDNHFWIELYGFDFCVSEVCVLG